MKNDWVKDISWKIYQQEKEGKGRNHQEGVLCAVNCWVVRKKEKKLHFGVKSVINLSVFQIVSKFFILSWITKKKLQKLYRILILQMYESC